MCQYTFYIQYSGQDKIIETITCEELGINSLTTQEEKNVILENYFNNSFIPNLEAEYFLDDTEKNYVFSIPKFDRRSQAEYSMTELGITDDMSEEDKTSILEDVLLDFIYQFDCGWLKTK